MAKKKAGRKKGSRNRGFFYRKGRGWHVVDDSRQVPLRYEDGTPIKAADADDRELRDACARWLVGKTGTSSTAAPQPGDGVTVLDVCLRYVTEGRLGMRLQSDGFNGGPALEGVGRSQSSFCRTSARKLQNTWPRVVSSRL